LGHDDEITVEHLSEDFLEQRRPVNQQSDGTEAADPGASSTKEPTSLDHLEMLAIRKAIEECGGNISAAARRLGISRNTLYRKWPEDAQ
jgi:transcriptional regulator of acetoin/glycerol metabolism